MKEYPEKVGKTAGPDIKLRALPLTKGYSKVRSPNPERSRRLLSQELTVPACEKLMSISNRLSLDIRLEGPQAETNFRGGSF